MDKEPEYRGIKKQLTTANQRLNESQELSRMGSWDWDIATNKIIWSDMMFKLLGLEPVSIEPSYEMALHYVHIKDKKKYEYVLAKALKSKTNYYLENLVTCEDLSTISVISRGKCILDEAGNLVRMIGTVQDVTDQKKMEDAKQKAHKEERLKSAFLENVSHELRTPLNAILGFSELIINKKVGDEKKEKYIEQINTSGQRLLSFLTDMVELSKIECEYNELFLEDSNLNKVMNDLHSAFKKTNQNKKIQLICHKALGDDESFIKTDVAKLRLILSKLINNSLKYTNDGFIEFGYVLEAGFIKFNIKDSGTGISKKIQENLFDRFGQISDPKAKHGKGAGLGLSIAKGLVNLFGGEIWLEPEMKKGSNFFFTIPYIKGVRKAKKPVTNQLIKSEKKTILIAEDDHANYLLFTIHMDNQFNILHAKNGKEAVEIFTENANTIDLILMDIRMPVMNGFEASIEIRKMNKVIPIIAHTAFSKESQWMQMEEAGMNDMLTKPVQLDRILQVIKKYS